MANLDLDIDFNGLDNDILNKSENERVDIYPRIVRYASSKGISKRAVDNMMLEVSGKYSNITDEELKKEALSSKECSKLQTTEEIDACVKSYIDKTKKRELRKSKNANFWNTLIGTVNQVGQNMNKNNATNNTSNTGSNNNNNNNDNPLPDADPRILGMKPLVFTLVALGTVTTLAIVTVLLMKRGKTPKK